DLHLVGSGCVDVDVGKRHGVARATANVSGFTRPRAVLAIWRSHRSCQRGVFRFIRRRFRKWRSSAAISTDDDAIHVRWIAGGAAKFDAVDPGMQAYRSRCARWQKEAAPSNIECPKRATVHAINQRPRPLG